MGLSRADVSAEAQMVLRRFCRQWMVGLFVGSVLLSGGLKFSSHRDHRWGPGGVRLCLTQIPQVFPIKICRWTCLNRARLPGPGAEGEIPLGSRMT